LNESTRLRIKQIERDTKLEKHKRRRMKMEVRLEELKQRL
jgi:hypothetical protein